MKENIAKELLKIEAVFLRPKDPFTWTSGIKSPIYCDNRLVLSYPETREKIENAIAETISKNFKDVQALVGTATAGIAHSAIVSHIMGIPMGYVRASAKGYGREKKIEGKIERGNKVVIIEDLISTAGSVIETLETLRAHSVEVLGIVSIFTYGMEKAEKNLKKHEIINVSLSNLDVLTKVAVEEKYITKEEKQQIISFRNNPQSEQWMKGE